MNKKGFTLIELLFVIVIVALISISSVLVFGNIDDDTSVKDRQNIYKDIQRGAILYIDLNDSWLTQFKQNGEIMLELAELKNSNYVDIDVQDPVTNREIPSNYMVKIYSAQDQYGNKFVDTCILNKTELLKSYCNRTRVCGQNNTTCKSVSNCNCWCTEEQVKNKECVNLCNVKACVANNKGKPGGCCEWDNVAAS